MNESDLPNNENKKSDEWKSWTPKQMISVFLHESRTPLIMIKGYTQILANEETQEHHTKAIEGISQATERLEVLWNDLASYMRELMENS